MSDRAEEYFIRNRLWAFQSDRRIRKSTVLVIGMGGLGSEVCKSVILAGVKSITMMDNQRLTHNDLYSHFLATSDKVGQNRATASLEMAQMLNPMVEIKVDENDPITKPDEYFSSFKAIVATECKLDFLLHLNKLCRKYKIKFFCADVYGTYGYMFLDLNKHAFAEEEEMEFSNKTENVLVKKRINYCSLKDALEVDWTSSKYKRLLKRLDSTYFLIRVFMSFRMKVKRDPSLQHDIKDMKLLKKLRKKTLRSLKLPPTVQIKDEELRMAFSEFGVVCGIIGGVLGYEVIQAISRQGEPRQNFFFYNPNIVLGQVVHLG